MSSIRNSISTGILVIVLACPPGCAHIGGGTSRQAAPCDSCDCDAACVDQGCPEGSTCHCDPAGPADDKSIGNWSAAKCNCDGNGATGACDSCGECAITGSRVGAGACGAAPDGSGCCNSDSTARSTGCSAGGTGGSDRGGRNRKAAGFTVDDHHPAYGRPGSACPRGCPSWGSTCRACGGNYPGCGCGDSGRFGLRGRLLGWFHGHRSHAIPETLPLGSTVRAHYQVMETNGEAADFIFHRHDFVGQTAQLTPDGRDKILEIAVRMKAAPFPVLVERSENNCDPELDQLRRNFVAQILTEYGVPDAECRTVVSPAYGRGLTGIEAEPTYYRHLLPGNGLYNGYGNGFGNGLFGGTGFGGGALGGGLGTGGFGF